MASSKRIVGLQRILGQKSAALAIFAAVALGAPIASAGSAKAKSAPDEEEPKTNNATTPSTTEPSHTDTPPPPKDDAAHPSEQSSTQTLVVGAPVDEASPEGGKLQIHPYFLISGGLKFDSVKNKPGEDRNDRVSTFMLGRIGLRARWLDFVYAESEFMASGGVGLHGTSAYEGQASLQVRQQLIRLSKYHLRLEVGRIVDEASVDFFSAHVAESFIQDTATRDPLLYDGFNLGNGIRGTWEVVDGLRVGATFNAANPVSSTSSLMIGGAYPPFDRFYIQAYQQVNQSANHFPDDTFHSMVFAPSVLLDTHYFDARAEIQMFDVNVDTTKSTDDHIRGYNARGTLRAKLASSLLVPFFSAAYTRNDTLVQTDVSKRSPDRYQAVNFGVGTDLDLARRFKCSHDCADGFGIQYQQVQNQIGEGGLVTTLRYFNIGATYWIIPNLSVGARFALWMQEQEQPVTSAQFAAGVRTPDVVTVGERSAIAALRFIMP